MPSNFTANYQLSQWEASDQVLRADFNADNAKIDAALMAKGNCQIVTGSYVGTGGYGSAQPNTLIFDRTPVMVILATNMVSRWNNAIQNYILHRGTAHGPAWSGGSSTTLEWTENSVSWWSNTAENQFNKADTTYGYTALLM